MCSVSLSNVYILSFLLLRRLAMIQYKTIALDRIIGKPKQKLNTVINPVAEIVKKEAVGGWEFVAITQIPIYVEPGCIKRMFGAEGFYDYAMMIIYKKED